MCGVIALVAKDSSPLEGATLFSMTNALRHRGPDDEGYALYDSSSDRIQAYAGEDTVEEIRAQLPRLNPQMPLPDVMLGHRRLAIVDVSARGHQPMSDETQRYWIVFNGEIYNWRELRHDLEILGHRFRSNADTEVILKAYQQWGEACVQRFNGEWAFVIFDQPARTLFLSRDRFGIKPLYFVDLPTVFAVASEPKALLCCPGVRALANPDAVWDYLVFSRTNHLPNTFFADIHALEPGTVATYALDSHTLTMRRFYHLAERGPVATNGCTFRELFLDAVRLRSVADVPLGVSLSGGVDSSSVSSALRLFMSRPVDAFVGVSPQDTEDVQHAAHLAALDGFTTHRVPLEPLPLEELRRVAYAYDQPFQEWSGAVGQWQIHRYSRRHVKTCLEGHGADEYLLGYPYYDAPYLLHLLRRGRVRAAGSEFAQLWRRYYRGQPWELFTPLARSFQRVIPDGILNTMERALSRSGRIHGRRMVSDQMLHQYQWARRPKRETFWEGISLRAAMLRNIYVERLPYFLHHADRNAMAHSVEARVPFLDHRLVEYGFAAERVNLIEGGLRKAPLRNSMQGLLPEAIRCRVQKQGMRHRLTDEWFREHRPRLTELVCANPFMARVVDRKVVQRWLQRDAWRAPEQRVLWRAVNLALWQDAFSAEWV
ncbi:MAG: asparagine synthase (glutamine-hydrolyzing) [Candidatus Omnitrophica bacterium]|nr:asparagine synthase (glutamine-hydrolyzing) [Candidatus Omnitrophota bacterium]